MWNLYYRNPRLLSLTVGLILVAGLASLQLLPRMEDPLLTQRVATINTLVPGADAERVDALVTQELEEALRELEEIKEIRSVSRAGVSTITVELRDDVYDSAPVWSRLRDKLGDVRPQLPAEALAPEVDQLDVKAYALILGLTWNLPEAPNFAILRRLAEELQDVLKSVPGTEDADLHGDPVEEIVVTISPDRLNAMGLTVADVAEQLNLADAKVAAGQLRHATNQMLLEVSGELDSLARIRATPIQYGGQSDFVLLGDMATLHKSIADPQSSLVTVSGRPGLTVSAMVRDEVRLDQWDQRVQEQIGKFRDRLPAGVELRTVFAQNGYVSDRFATLIWNLVMGALAVMAVVLLLMGWRNALVVGLALPLACLMVLAGMRALEIPIHQMSVTGLILALGLLIDNAIVVVDEVTERTRAGAGPLEGVAQTTRHLFVPLVGSTLTTAFAFGPIALMPGPAGEFVSAIAISVILAILSSLFLAVTIVPAVAMMLQPSTPERAVGLWENGLAWPGLARLYRQVIAALTSHPMLGLLAGVILPILGFAASFQLPEQFFPPSDRDQVYLELELPLQASLLETRRATDQVREILLRHSAVRDVHWFIGESAPPFYYNVIPRRKNVSRYAQALVQLHAANATSELIQQLQQEVDLAVPSARVLVRQLEQGPPFDAPVEVRLFGPDLATLRSWGESLRQILAETDDVIHTRSELTELQPKLKIQVDQEQARVAGLAPVQIAAQLNGTLEGIAAGSVLESTEELTVRVRTTSQQRAQFDRLASLNVLPAGRARGADVSEDEFPAIPLTALARFDIQSEFGTIPRFNGRRMNEVQAFIAAGVLPSKTLAAFRSRLEEAGLEVPPGYELQYGGEAAKRNDAVGNLMANVGILSVLMLATLVLSFGSFRLAGIVSLVALLSVGLGLGGLWLFGYPFGFMAIVGTMGLIGVAINDAIVVLAALHADPQARQGDRNAIGQVVRRSTRHVVATSLTTMAGFAPLILGGGGFWPPLAVSIAGGVGGATLLALFFVPSCYLLLMGNRPPITLSSSELSVPVASCPETVEDRSLQLASDGCRGG